MLIRWCDSLVFPCHFLLDSRGLGLGRHHNRLLPATRLPVLLMLHVHKLAVVVRARNFQAVVLHVWLAWRSLGWTGIVGELHLGVTHVYSMLLCLALDVRLLDN
jgi:hypothetical protein